MRLILRGDKPSARKYIGFARARLNDMKNIMDALGLGYNKKYYKLPDADIVVESRYGLDSAWIVGKGIVVPAAITIDSTIDCWIQTNTVNLGNNTSLVIQKGDGTGLFPRSRSLLRFTFSTTGTISNAILSLWYNNKTGDLAGETAWAYRLTETNWTELGATWDDYDGINSWATAGGDFTTSNGASTVIPVTGGPGFVDPEQYINFDVTNQVLYARANTASILHIIIKLENDVDVTGGAAAFASREVIAPQNPPRLVIT